MTDTPTHELDEHTAALWSELDQVRAAVRELKAREDQLAATIRERGHGYGTYGLGGQALYALAPNRRFSIDAALAFITPTQLEASIKQNIDPEQVKRHLTPDQLEACMVEQGNPKVVRA